MRGSILKRSSLLQNKVAITTTSFAEYDRAPVAVLEEHGVEVVLNLFKRKLEKSEILELCSGCIGIVAGTETYDRDLLEALKELKVISRCGVGTDGIDLKAAKEIGIMITTTPDGPTLAVAELTVALALDLLRRVSFMDRMIRAGVWKKEMGSLLSLKKIGVIGFGRIGRRVAELFRSFGCEVSYADPFVNESGKGFNKIPLDRLLSESDIITVHVSGKDEVLGEKELGLIKNGGWLINVSRGGTVNEGALHHLLKAGRLSGAALDVFGVEPYKGPLTQMDNVILTPHVGSYAKEARILMERESVHNLLNELKGAI
jgi:D-3-phosphoglycerate dehydrogenase